MCLSAPTALTGLGLRPDVFEQAFRAAKTTCDPGLIMNPGVLLRP